MRLFQIKVNTILQNQQVLPSLHSHSFGENTSAALLYSDGTNQVGLLYPLPTPALQQGGQNQSAYASEEERMQRGLPAYWRIFI